MLKLFLKWLPIYGIIYGVIGVILGTIGGLYQTSLRTRGEVYERLFSPYWRQMSGFLLLSHRLKEPHPDLPTLPKKTYVGLIPLSFLQTSVGSIVGSIFCIVWGQRGGVGDAYALYGLYVGGILGALTGIVMHHHLLTLLLDFRVAFVLTAITPFFGIAIIGMLVLGILGWLLGALVGGILWKQYFQYYGELVLKIVVEGLGIGGVLGGVVGGLHYGFSGVFSWGIRGMLVGMSASWLPILFLPLVRMIERGVSHGFTTLVNP